MKPKKLLRLVALLLLLSAAVAGYRFYQIIYAPNLELAQAERVVYFPTGGTWEQALDSLHPYLKRPADFEWVARKKGFPKKLRPGRYALQEGWSNNQLADYLRSGEAKPVQLTLQGTKNLYELSAVLGKHLESDSLDFLRYLQNPEHLQDYAVKPETVIALFLANTYQLHWHSSPAQVLERFHREWKNYWNEKREKKREKLKLTRIEVVTLASIVESETAMPDEMPRVAGLYLNRLERGMKLQSDPTVIHGIQRDFPQREIRRVLYRDLQYDSPYNTYIYRGLPPGPLRAPEPAALNAVLNAEKHNYIFMVANPEKPGYHLFGASLNEHNRNRQKYIQWINKQGIMR